MALSPSRRPRTALRLRSSHSGRIRLSISHRTGTWSAPAKDADRVYPTDLESPLGHARPRTRRQR
jgi:hypothetical protein